MQKKYWKNGYTVPMVALIALVSGSQAQAQTAPIFGGLPPAMDSPLSKIPGIGKLFGGGGKATKGMQQMQFMLDKAHQAAVMAEELKQTASLITSLGNTPTLSVISDLDGIQKDMQRLMKNVENVYDDDFGSGSVADDIEYKTRQAQRALDRLDKINQSIDEAAKRQVIIRDGTAKSVAAGKSSNSVLGALQGNMEVGSMQVAATQENTAAVNNLLAIEAAREARDFEEQELARKRACKRNSDNEFFQQDWC